MTATRLDKTLDNSEITGQKQGLETPRPVPLSAGQFRAAKRIKAA